METIYTTYNSANPLLFEEENLLGYCVGGYHPLVIGDALQSGRYDVHHKLGHGGYSTVWLCRDNRFVVRESRPFPWN